MKKKLGSILLVMLLIFSMMQISVFPIYAATVSDDWLYLDGSKSGISASFDTSTGLLTISGTGEMPFYDRIYGSPPPWEDYREDITSVTINNGVKNISSYAFALCTNMKTIIIPSSVISIGEAAFGGCSKLTNITLPSSITEIAFWAFDGCDSLENIYFKGNAPSVYAADSGWENADGYWTNTASFDKDLVTLHYLSDKSGWTSPRWEGYRTTASSGNLDIPSITEPQKVKTVYRNGEITTYSLDWFIKNKSSTIYDPELAELAMAFSRAVYDEQSVTKSLHNHDFSIKGFGNYTGFNITQPAYVIAEKTMDSGDKIVVVIIRGSDSAADWITDFLSVVGSFADATENIADEIFNIYGTGTLPKGTKFLFTGHSYGGTIANTIAASFSDGYSQNDVYSYTFGAPNVNAGIVLNSSKYKNIFNIVNVADPVPKLLPLSNKYGSIYRFTADTFTDAFMFDNHSGLVYLNFLSKQKTPDNNGYLDNSNTFKNFVLYGILCPVDVDIYKDGILLAQFINDQPVYHNGGENDLILYTIDDEKYFVSRVDNKYTVKLTGTDNGSMTYSVQEINALTDEVIVTKSFENIALSSGKQMISEIEDPAKMADVRLYVTDANGKVLNEIEGKVSIFDNLNSASDWAREGIKSAIAKGFVPVELQSSYKNIITRAEFCRMAVKWVEYATGKSIDAVLAEKGVSRNLNAFTDTKDSDILAAFALGITNGTGNNQFTPNGQFTREQAATMIMNTCNVTRANVSNSTASGFADLNTASNWAVDGINFVRAYGIMQGTGNNNFSPKLTYTREQSILTFDNIEPEKLINSTPTITPAKMGTVTIEYDFNGGFGQAPSHKVIKDKDGIAVYYLTESIPIRDGYEFLGWRFEDSLHYGIDNPGDDITFDLGNPTTSEILTYYAQWEPIRQTQTASVSFSNMKAYWLDGNFYFSCDYIADGNVTKTGFTMTTRGGSRTISSDSNLSSDAYTMSNPYIRNGVDTSGGWKYDETYSWTAFAIVDGKRVESQTQSFVFSSPSGS